MTAAARAYQGRRVLVTGATGFIGRHVVTALDAAGAEVVAAVRPGREAPWPWDSPGVVVEPIDLAGNADLGRAIARIAPVVTFNLAGYGVDPAERDVALAKRINSDLPAELVVACRAAADPSWHGRRLVHVGSALEYGTAAGDLAEETTPLPTTLYGSTKLAGTRAVERAVVQAGLPAVTARLFTVYGPGEHPGRLLPTLLRAVGGRDPIPLTAGTQRRDFTHVGDVVEGLLRLGTLAGRVPATMNLATGTLVTVREFTERAADVLGIDRERLRFGALPIRGEEMAHAPVSVARLDAALGWHPSRSIEAGVRQTARAGGSAAE